MGQYTSSGRTTAGLILNDGAYWVMYGLVGNSAQLAGVAQGTGTYQSGSFQSSNGKDFNFEGAGVGDFTLDASYAMKQSFSGTVRYTASGSTVTLASTYDAAYDLVPNLSIIAANYYGYVVTTGGPEYATATISLSGAVTGGSASGCSFSGSSSPRTHGNVYNLSVTFSGGPCANGSSTVTGIGYFDASAETLYGAALNASRTIGFLFVGRKGTDQSASIISAFTDIILVDEKLGFEQDEVAIDQSLAARGLYLSGVHVSEYKANLLSHVQSSFDRQVTEIIALSGQQSLSRGIVVPFVSELSDEWLTYMQQATTTHIGSLNPGGNIVAQTITELAGAIGNIRDGAVSQLDASILWSP